MKTELKEVSFAKKESTLPTQLYYDGNVTRAKGYTTRDLFEWWISGKLDKKINKIVVLGLLE